ncbi:hypothetical protein [Bradyrhizobium diazoefficiens]|uniref:hypothetical protein n=1 Tax=Bradyrhizobium diazoefficiens TaxID=1355477 RepID=UPI0004B90673|nr:hypothetical protein [Bradyrhizobium diazoefficiens]
MAKDFTAAPTDFMGDILETKRESAVAMLGAIDKALFEGSLVMDTKLAVAGVGIPFAFKSREDMVAERARLANMID